MGHLLFSNAQALKKLLCDRTASSHIRTASTDNRNGLSHNGTASIDNRNGLSCNSIVLRCNGNVGRTIVSARATTLMRSPLKLCLSALKHSCTCHWQMEQALSV
ncbi:MAG: hypothetical protein KME11_14050 [Timaviella obliquedivisa GSE-PSE-MK23-08B]|nr:hypothetical protein [Timaviella obliquedivisa GSE-PSE-MK23-08B]